MFGKKEKKETNYKNFYEMKKEAQDMIKQFCLTQTSYQKIKFFINEKYAFGERFVHRYLIDLDEEGIIHYDSLNRKIIYSEEK